MLRQLQIIVIFLCVGTIAGAQAPERSRFSPGSASGVGPDGSLADSDGNPPSNAMFDALDGNGDGEITMRELRRAVVALKQLDMNEDGKITRAEAMGGPAGDTGAQVERLMQNDKNGDGKLTADELPRHIVQMLAGADTNGDGAIDRTELAMVVDGAAMDGARQQFGARRFGRGAGGFRGANGDPRPSGPNLLQYDRNGDGRLSPHEVPTNMRGMLQGADQNGNGTLDGQELQAVRQRMNERLRGQRPLPPGISIGPQGVQRTPPQR